MEPVSLIPLAVQSWPGTGPRVLALPGFLDCAGSFAALASECAAFCRLSALDWRGHGASSSGGEGASFHQLDHLKDLLGLLESLRAKNEAPDVLVAHSMGGILACLLAGALPDRCPPKILLLDALGGTPGDAALHWDRWAKMLLASQEIRPPFRVAPNREAALQRIQKRQKHLPADASERLLDSIGETQEDGTVRWRLDPRLLGPNPFVFPEEHWLELLGRITAAVTVVIPEYGVLARHPAAASRLAALRHAERVDIVACGHPVHLEQPQAVAQALAAMLA